MAFVILTGCTANSNQNEGSGSNKTAENEEKATESTSSKDEALNIETLTEKSVKVLADQVDCYSYPSDDARINVAYPYNSVISVHGKVKKDDCTWYQIGNDYWIADKNGENLRILDNLSTSETVLKFEKPEYIVKKGETITVRIIVINGFGTDNYGCSLKAGEELISAEDNYNYENYFPEGEFAEGRTGFLYADVTGLNPGTTNLNFWFGDNTYATTVITVQ